MLFGQLPFHGKTKRELYRKVLKNKYDLNKSASREVKNLIRRLIVVDPLQRITIDEIKDHPWFNQIKSDKNLERFHRFSISIPNIKTRYTSYKIHS